MKKKKIIVIVGVSLLFLTVGVSAATIMYTANNVTYSSSTLSGNNVQIALENLYHKYQNSTTTPPSGMTCTQKTNIKCIRATTLHTETCTNSSTSQYCQGAGYALNATITYGNQTTTEGVLTTGDAFDCDVDGTGYNHRFYYVSDYYDTSTKNFNDKIAVLIYYSNVRGGVANTSGTAYDSSNQNYNGPVTAREQLPTTTQWSNIRLYKDTRQILAQNNATSTSGGTLPTSFSYAGYAARLLTYQEAYHGCNSYDKNPKSTGGLEAKCQFLMEGTKFSNSSLATYGPWLESPIASYSNEAFSVYAYLRNLAGYGAYSASSTNYGVRPTIEILKSEILTENVLRIRYVADNTPILWGEDPAENPDGNIITPTGTTPDTLCLPGSSCTLSNSGYSMPWHKATQEKWSYNGVEYDPGTTKTAEEWAALAGCDLNERSCDLTLSLDAGWRETTIKEIYDCNGGEIIAGSSATPTNPSPVGNSGSSCYQRTYVWSRDLVDGVLNHDPDYLSGDDASTLPMKKGSQKGTKYYQIGGTSSQVNEIDGYTNGIDFLNSFGLTDKVNSLRNGEDVTITLIAQYES